MARVFAEKSRGPWYAVARRQFARRPRGWRPIDRSDSALIGPDLHYGERARLGPVSLTIPVEELGAGPAWIVSVDDVSELQ
jgi:hypothetical protein